MSSPDCKRQKLADDVNSVAKMSKVLTKNAETQTENATSTASTSKKLTFIDISAQKFIRVAESDGFVDRTMLIEELVGKKPTYAMIFAPSKFGKTINLDMIRLFCDIEDKDTKTKEDIEMDPTMQELRLNPSENMEVFLRKFEGKQYEECLILKREQFVIQHFGRHPVVLLNFKDCTAESKSDAIFFCAQQVHKGYLENGYLYCSEEFLPDNAQSHLLKTTCTDWINYSRDQLKQLILDDVIVGLKILIISLWVHWERKPVFLVDEVDTPCVRAMEKMLSAEQVREIGTTISHLLCSILKSEDEQLELQAALVTGICKFIHSGMSPIDNTVPVYFLSDDRFSKYYGLTAQEVDTLVEKFCGSQGDAEKTNKIIREIKARYNGYCQRSLSVENNNDARYCLFSVLNYMHNTIPHKWCFWFDRDSLVRKLVPILRKSVEIMNAIQILCFNHPGTIEIEYRKAVDVQHILGLYRGEVAPNLNAVFNFFLQRGYLAHNPEKPIENVTEKKMNVRIPNLEVKQIYKEMFF